MKMSDLWVHHPPYEVLSAFLDRDLESRAFERVARHVAECKRCRHEMRLLRDADAVMPEVPMPVLPGDLFARIRERQETGMVLPLLPPDRPPQRPRRARLASTVALVMVLAAAALFVVRTGRLGADASTLTVETSATGSRVIDYGPSSLLAGEDSVRLRLWGWDGDDRLSIDPTYHTATLTRSGRGFAGEVPAEAAGRFNLLVVESLDGERIDTNSGDLWDDPAGEIAEDADAALARLDALVWLGRSVWVDPADLVASAEGALERFPRDPRVVHYAFVTHTWLTPEVPDSIVWRYRDYMGLFMEADREVTEPGLQALARFARTLGDADAEARWIRRLESLNPDNRWARRVRARRFSDEAAGDPGVLDSLLEDEWVRRGGGATEFLDSSVRVLRSAGAAPSIVTRWAERQVGAGVPTVDLTLRAALADPDLRRWAIPHAQDWIRQRLTRADSLRPPHMTRSEFATIDAIVASRMREDLGAAQLAIGDTASAVRTLDLALTNAWDLETALSLHRILEDDPTVDGRARRTELGRWIAVDPFADAGVPIEAEEVAAARAEVLARVPLRRRGVPVGSNALNVRELDGDEITLSKEDRAVLALWEEGVGTTRLRRAEEELRPATAKLRALGIPLYIVGTDLWRDQIEEAARRSGSVGVLDPEGNMSSAFDNRYAPIYVVIDDGRYWMADDPMNAARVALLLPREEAVVARGPGGSSDVGE